MAVFNSYVKLPEAKPPFSHGFPMVYQRVMLNYRRVCFTISSRIGFDQLPTCRAFGASRRDMAFAARPNAG